jgi:anthranilate phosphoribosyltransferase
MNKDLLEKLQRGEALSETEAYKLLEGVIGGATQDEIRAMLLAFNSKGEDVSEVVGLVRAMRAHAVALEAPRAFDVVGTGGDGSGTFNISTATAFVVAGAGVPVAKHGNRAASSKCGSADVLEALGVNIMLTKEQAEEVFKKTRFVFMLAPLYHPAMKQVGAVRKELKVRTVFNILGPFSNPAGTKRQLTGVPTLQSARMLAEAAQRLEYERIGIVTSDDGMDEISVCAPTQFFDVTPREIVHSVIYPEQFGLERAEKSALMGGAAIENAEMLRAVLSGEKGARTDAVLLNAAHALFIAGASPSPNEGVDKARLSIMSGSAKAVLEGVIAETSKYKA